MSNKVLAQGKISSVFNNTYIMHSGQFDRIIDSEIYYSSDAVTWKPTEILDASFYNERMMGIPYSIYADDKFLLFSLVDTFYRPRFLLYSTDGVSWQTTNITISQYELRFAYGDGLFIASEKLSNNALRSTDGVSWTPFTLPAGNYGLVSYGNGKFVAVDVNNTTTAAYSTDSVTWTATTLPESSYYKSIVFGEDKFVLVSDYVGRSAYSTDGIAWNTITDLTTFSSDEWVWVTHGDGKFMTVAEDSSNPIAAYSTNGINWTEVSLPVSDPLFSVVYGDQKFVAVAGNFGDNTTVHSTDGITWTVFTAPGVDSTTNAQITYGPAKRIEEITQYTVPNNTESLISSIYIANNSEASETYSIWVVPNGETKSDLHYFRKDVTIESKDFDIIETGISLSEGDQIITFGSSDLVSINIFGTEK